MMSKMCMLVYKDQLEYSFRSFKSNLHGNEPERSPKAKPDTTEQTISPNRNGETFLANAKLVTVFPPSKTRNDEDTTKFNI